MCVAFGGVAALTDVSVTVGRGEILGLIGPNGAGKTTLLNVLSGFQRSSSGQVLLDDDPITDVAPHDRVRAGVVRTFQSGRVFPDLVVRDNVLAGALGIGLRRPQAEELADEMLERTGLAAQAHRYASELPYGDERRLAVVRALATQPAFLLLDEPAAGLNEKEGDRLTETIVSIPRDFGCGVVVIEHDMRVIMGACDRIHVLDRGRTLAVGKPDEVRAEDAVITAYFGGVSMADVPIRPEVVRDAFGA